MNVLLISAPLGVENNPYKSFSPPLGILYIAATLEENGIKVEVIDGDQEINLYKTIEDFLRSNFYEIIAVGSTTPSFINAVEIGTLIKKHSPHSLLVFGGYHPTFNAERILRKYPFVDICVRGEREHTILEIAQGKNLFDIKGISFKEEGKIINNQDRDQINDLDSLRFPARHLIKKYDYAYSSNYKWYDLRRYYKRSNLSEYMSVSTSRGCPFGCKYCSNTMFAKRKFRPRSPGNIIREIEDLVAQGHKKFFFVDDNFTASPSRVFEFCKLLREKNLKIEWVSFGRVDLASEELFSAMANAGCILLMFGIESGSQRILDYYNKKANIVQIKKAVWLAKKCGLGVMAFLMIGAPIETFDDVRKTLRLIKNIPIDFIEISKLGIVTGTPLWEEHAHARKIDADKNWEKLVFSTEIYEKLSPVKLKMWSRYLYFSFYCRPSYVFRQIRNMLKGGKLCSKEG